MPLDRERKATVRNDTEFILLFALAHNSKDKLEMPSSGDVKTIGLSLLMWAAVGGIADPLIILTSIIVIPRIQHRVSDSSSSTLPS